MIHGIAPHLPSHAIVTWTLLRPSLASIAEPVSLWERGMTFAERVENASCESELTVDVKCGL